MNSDSPTPPPKNLLQDVPLEDRKPRVASSGDPLVAAINRLTFVLRDELRALTHSLESEQSSARLVSSVNTLCDRVRDLMEAILGHY